jgi:4-amino-4-deoxy-L-arabinose transferase-like glycosyltransferase
VRRHCALCLQLKPSRGKASLETLSSTLISDPPIEILEEKNSSAQTASNWPAEERKARRLLILVVLVALALRIFVTLLPIGGDQMHIRQQGRVAEALLAGRGFGSPFRSNQVAAIMPPVYPLIVAAFFKLFGVQTTASILAVHVFDSALSALACIPVFLMARRSFGERVALWAAWGWAFSPYGIYFAASWAWSTHLLLLCLCWLVVLAQQLEQSPRLGLWAGFGLLAGFAGLVEPSVLVVIPFLLALACWRLRIERKRWLAPGLIACTVMTAAISPWMIRNAMVFHRFIPMRDNMGLELWLGNNGRSVHWTNDDLNPEHNKLELAEYSATGELAYMDHKMRQAKTYIGDHPGWYAWMCVRRAIYLWTGYWSFNRGYLAQEPMDLANIPFTTCLTLLALLGLMTAWRERPWECIRYAGVLFLFPFMYYFVHPGVYRMRPLDPLIVILGCQSILAISRRVRKRAQLSKPTPLGMAQN